VAHGKTIVREPPLPPLGSVKKLGKPFSTSVLRSSANFAQPSTFFFLRVLNSYILDTENVQPCSSNCRHPVPWALVDALLGCHMGVTWVSHGCHMLFHLFIHRKAAGVLSKHPTRIQNGAEAKKLVGTHSLSSRPSLYTSILSLTLVP